MKPRRLKTLPPRRGTLTVVSRNDDGTWFCKCDYERVDTRPDFQERWVADQGSFTVERIKQLTGIDVEAP